MEQSNQCSVLLTVKITRKIKVAQETSCSWFQRRKVITLHWKDKKGCGADL